MNIEAALVKALREKTGAGFMQCKRALIEANADIEAAEDLMRKRGALDADKKQSRITAEGIVVSQIADDKRSGVLLEVNCETDFVARSKPFQAFVSRLISLALENKTDDVDALMQCVYDEKRQDTVESMRQQLVVELGENIRIHRLKRIATASGYVMDYCHGVRIGVLVMLSQDNDDLSRDVAMHIAASSPLAIAPQDVSPMVIEKEREIYFEQAKLSGKPAEIIEKIVRGKLNKYLESVALLEQPFVKDPDIKVKALLQSKQADILDFFRLELGEA